MIDTDSGPGQDAPRKAKFLDAFSRRKVVGSALREINGNRAIFRGWLAADAEFRQDFSDACETIDDELLELALCCAGVLRKPRGRQVEVDRTILLALLKRHSRLRDDGASDGGPAAITINIKGADPKALVQVLGAKLPQLDTGLPDGLATQRAKMLEGPQPEASA